MSFEKTITGDEYIFKHSNDSDEKKSKLVLHNHNDTYETLIFISGDAEFTVEGSTYKMSPGDVIVINNNEMHRMKLTGESVYERIVINTTPKFFYMYPELKNIFRNRRLGIGNVLKPDDFLLGTIHDICSKIEKYNYMYSDVEFSADIIKNLILEIMFLLNRAQPSCDHKTRTDDRIKQILEYINDNLSASLSLDLLSKKFFVNKYHLCRIFKMSTGMTITSYVNYKRLLLARELHEEGKTLTNASFEAGFDNYSSFYKIYRREFGHSPNKS